MQYRSVIALAGVSLVLSGCAGSGAEGDLAAAASTVTTTQTVTAPAETVTVAPDAVTVTVETTNEEAEPPSHTEAEAQSEETESADDTTAIELPSDDQPLGLDDFFNHASSWEEGRWNVANRANERGVSINLSYDTELELRLQNQFTSLRFDAGQANDSASSECLTKVDIMVDGEVRETREFGFNMIQEFAGIDVADGNAVKLKIDNARCAARVVLSRIQVD
ncbi:hypothetical protein [Ornithinimicrobium cryptoxanthini]|uniref:Uncharacterized protein n=1 Tax=Ornithinimicrobium cryptoxanthini TaxID=2934161 RepID=A0ABY4YKS3_9MICO|nr:hypothetical protein [Ornithinimicrobium cryptoxanthini]USQ77303.1 hypothetical protein NF557_05150 [Ornithinimicrobium cryptoxanthini]